MKTKNLFVGIDLGGKRRKTTGICILQHKNNLAIPHNCKTCQLVTSPEITSTIRPYLKYVRVIAVDGPLTVGKGKGAMRLYEKFLSTKVFRQHRVQPLPPALMPEIVLGGVKLVKELEKSHFILHKNLIEVFPTLTKGLCGHILNFNCPSPHQESALLCAWEAWLHWKGKTRWIGHKDGFLFVPEPSLWKEHWRKDFEEAWEKRHGFKYRYLRTNIFSNVDYGHFNHCP